MKKQHILSSLLFVGACGALLASFSTGGEPAPAPTPAKVAHVASSEWLTNIGHASKIAKQQNRDLLVWFSGHGWNDASDALAKTANSAAFLQKASERCVLVNINFQNDGGKSLNSDPAATVWADRLNVTALPALVLLDSDERPYATLDASAPSFESAAATRAARDAAFTRARSLSGADKAAALDAGLSSVRSFAAAWYEPELTQLVAIDSPAATKWAPILAETVIDRTIQRDIYPMVDATHYQQAVDRIDTLIKATRMSVSQRQLLVAFKAQLFCSLNDLPKANALFDEAIALDPAGPATDRIRSAQAKLAEPAVN